LILNAKIFIERGKIPSDYRRYFISLLKAAFQGTEFEDIVLSRERIPKPYTFSVGFSRIVRQNIDSLEFESPVFFNFSTPIHTMIAHLYNHVKNLPTLFSKEVKEIQIHLPPPVTIKSREMVFKIMGCAVLTRNYREGEVYVHPEDDDFEEAFNHSLKIRLEYFREKFSHFGHFPKFSLVKVLTKNLEKTVIKHYGGVLEGFRGTLKLQGDPKILNFLVEAGIGIRTGQGFGMVKVVKF